LVSAHRRPPPTARGGNGFSEIENVIIVARSEAWREVLVAASILA
jgi:hypothetical protein